MYGGRHSCTEVKERPTCFGSRLKKKHHWDLYLDTASTHSSGSESISPSTESSSSTSPLPLSPLPSTSYLSSSSSSSSSLLTMPSLALSKTTADVAHQYFTLMTDGAAEADGTSLVEEGGTVEGGFASSNFDNSTMQNMKQQQQLLQQHHQQLQQQQQLLLQQQHQLAAATMAQQQFALARVTNSQQDEISKSLKMFAMLTAYKTGNEQLHQSPPSSKLPVDAIMQDFACNGYICDELNRYQQFQAAINYAHQQPNGSSGCSGGQLLPNNNNIINHHNANDMRNNFWKNLPSQIQHTQVAAAAAAAANIDYNISNSNRNSSSNQNANGNHNSNGNGNGNNINNKRPHKRYQGGAKNDKFSSAKHCVFCENNNEPEAVVKSHAVRDSLGRVLCPKLRTYICPICGSSGDMAHTVKYCPQKPIITMEDALKAESFRLAKSTFYKHQMKV